MMRADMRARGAPVAHAQERSARAEFYMPRYEQATCLLRGRTSARDGASLRKMF